MLLCQTWISKQVCFVIHKVTLQNGSFAYFYGNVFHNEVMQKLDNDSTNIDHENLI